MKIAVLSVLISLLATASEPASLAAQLDDVARTAAALVDGDACERILTDRARGYLLRVDPRDQWAAADNFDVRHDAYIQTKKLLIRLGRLGPPHTDVNLWMPVPGSEGRIQIVIRNANEISQFWQWGELHQPATPEMKEVLATGKRRTVTKRPGFVSVLAPVTNSLGDVVGLVETVSQLKYDPHGNVK